MNKIPKAKYEELFNEKHKAEAFDKIAELYYNQNFGSTSKQDIDLLMFSIYIEQILDKTETDISTYSDYTLSKVLGITQSKIRNLKERKELKYPYEKFDWKKSFERVSRNATYENEKIKIELHDKNLYNEIKNFIEEKGGYVDVKLNTTLLQISPCYYIDFLLDLENDKNREEIRKKLKKQFELHQIDTKYFDKESIGKQLTSNLADNIICDVLEEIPFKNTVQGIVRNFINILKNNM